ncbi:betaine/proline/choline family ABC transporter ATP-binding protein [Saccharopolyspora sp. NPDC049357]|uniref:quaternary amine ABC transporter ATP-binding protein n=1 Tax=Saccharopolyspora sp. NPDC049357 TaxID=3154507 RepID=UPI00342D57B0
MNSVRVERLYKIFGPQPAEKVRRLEQGADPADLEAEGTTAAVVDASFSVAEGETFVVMGLSGSGKSTLIRMLNGLLTPTSGQVFVDDTDITAMSPREVRTMRQQKMSMVFQHFALFPHRTVLDNAGYGLKIRGTDKDEIAERAREALSMVGLEGWEERYPAQLSGGMRQRVGLARALAAHTDVLLMDEAFSALDPLIKREMQDQLLDLNAQLSKTIIFITHDLNEAMRLGDRIAVMRAGRIVQIGDSEQILREPADDYVAKFVQDVDRSRVLTAGSISDPTISAPDGVQPVEASTPLKDLFARIGESGTVPVVDAQQQVIGAVTPQAVFAALSHRAELEEA